MNTKAIFFAASLSTVVTLTAGMFSPAAAAPSFPRAVEQVLLHQDKGPVSKLPADKKRELIACVNQVLTALPTGKKRFVIEAANYDELEDRFGKVVMENRAEWKQKIAASCASIVV
jgi:hypothetical protein